MANTYSFHGLGGPWNIFQNKYSISEKIKASKTAFVSGYLLASIGHGINDEPIQAVGYLIVKAANDVFYW